MILSLAVIAGVGLGLLSAALEGERYQPVQPSHLWLILVGALPQVLAFYLPATRERIPESWIPFGMISSMLILLVFVWLNRQKRGMWILGLGLILNLLVISLNGGWMPISPETLISQGAADGSWELGFRHGYSKDMVLLPADTHLWFLSDVLTLPRWLPIRVAFSIGDVLIAAGVIFILYHRSIEKEEKK